MDYEIYIKPLKRNLIVVSLIVTIMLIIGWNMSPHIIQYFLSLTEFSIMTVAPFEMIQTKFSITIMFAVAAILPFAYIMAYRFVSPALYKKESNIVKWSSIPFFVMFILGVIFAVKIFLPIVLIYLNMFYVADVVNSVTLCNYISFIMSSMIMFGVIFCIPVILSVLSYIGVINYGIMKHYRRHVYVCILIMGAVITPPDAFTQLLVSIPLMLLYETSIGVSYIMSIKSKNKLKVISNA